MDWVGGQNPFPQKIKQEECGIEFYLYPTFFFTSTELIYFFCSETLTHTVSPFQLVI